LVVSRFVRFSRIPLLLLAGLPLAAAEPVDGRQIFGDHCASCHGTDGRARTPAGRKVGAKDLAQSTASEAEVRERILAGLKDPGGAIRMPSFADRLSPEAVSAVAAYVKTFRR
jgi:mono/diheme cytochrome c family protein